MHRPAVHCPAVHHPAVHRCLLTPLVRTAGRSAAAWIVPQVAARSLIALIKHRLEQWDGLQSLQTQLPVRCCHVCLRGSGAAVVGIARRWWCGFGRGKDGEISEKQSREDSRGPPELPQPTSPPNPTTGCTGTWLCSTACLPLVCQDPQVLLCRAQPPTCADAYSCRTLQSPSLNLVGFLCPALQSAQPCPICWGWGQQ